METQADSVTNATPPLKGVKILDFSRIIAGPLATQQLADLGATIIKIENPVTGDDVRGLDENGQPARSPFFIGFNRNKKSVAIDLKDPAGQAMALDLARQCDVLVQNFRPGVMDRFGLDHERVMAVCPKLIYVSISAYGEHGSMRDRPGYDPVLQAESGMMALTGEPDGRPMRTALSLIDTLTAGHATSAICAALIGRASTGRGDYLDLALLDTAIAALGNMAMAWLGTGVLPVRAGNAHIYATPNGLFRTATDPIYMAIASNSAVYALLRKRHRASRTCDRRAVRHPSRPTQESGGALGNTGRRIDEAAGGILARTHARSAGRPGTYAG